MKRGVDISGHVFGSLTAIRPVIKSRNNTWKWLCRCVCGNEEVLFLTALRGGKKRSCKPCLNARVSVEKTTHGLTKSPTYLSWKSMKARCLNPKSPDWKYYGARGITVCDRWLESFENFLADMGVRPAGLTLDRKENDGNYEPGNCRWATSTEQARNRARKAA